ncbi:unnamed protein product [Hermetia illucens]|uniref:Uncharacterized protein n=1 Tax=Hermetia illucens TaxID=343691 RepID=A0A7R8YUK7_HERIL|nr:uncharacterized protein LOC119651688 [Hermetia illucens]XP_037911322.1 uncharacterized protein LOC119651688 [Hermetia illucens]XP_037911323.1 uncharacterized protein LOC119651688 [Hermetia illucens]CAD7085907.1 unnamed protein product [Hermetia illucens]
MMARISSNIALHHLLILAVVLASCTARPQNSIDNQDGLEYQPNLGDIQSYYSYPSQVALESAPINQLQYFIKQLRPASGNSNNFDSLYRVPETKRQMRYRQCYFNPISCFKK